MNRPRHPAIVALVLAVYLVLSLYTNTLGPLIPEIIGAFGLSLTAAGFLPFAFFAAYGIASIPAGLLIERAGEKRVMVGAWLLALAAAASFATFPRYGVAIGSFFAMGVAMAALQVAANPLLRVAGGEEEFAFWSTSAQLVFGAGSFAGPRLYAWVEGGGASFLAPPAGLRWLALYWLFAAGAAVMALVLFLAPLPRVVRGDDDRLGGLGAHRTLLRSRAVPLYFVSIFMYVGSEQGVASWLSQLLASQHGLDPRTVGASAVSWFWGLMTVGCVVGLVTLRFFEPRRVLVTHAAIAMALLAVGLLGGPTAARLALPAIGFFASVMWPVIFALALGSVPSHHGTFSGILCTAVVGGAIVPLVVGRVGDVLGLRAGMAVLFLSFGWVLGIGFWARPLAASEA